MQAILFMAAQWLQSAMKKSHLTYRIIRASEFCFLISFKQTNPIYFSFRTSDQQPSMYRLRDFLPFFNDIVNLFYARPIGSA